MRSKNVSMQPRNVHFLRSSSHHIFYIAISLRNIPVFTKWFVFTNRYSSFTPFYKKVTYILLIAAHYWLNRHYSNIYLQLSLCTLVPTTQFIMYSHTMQSWCVYFTMFQTWKRRVHYLFSETSKKCILEKLDNSISFNLTAFSYKHKYHGT